MSASLLVLVLNCGSSSIKFSLIDEHSCRLHGLVENIGQSDCRLICKATATQSTWAHADHAKALATLLPWLNEQQPLSELQAVGHRVVHGGTTFTQATRITPEVIQQLQAIAHLAPLHNPVNIIGIQTIQSLLPNTPQVAVFDTAFHQSMPAHAFRYAVPEEWFTQHHVRRFGFHGISHQYIAEACAQTLSKPIHQLQIISAHLGNGGSVCAIQNGKSVDTTMGLTPLEGIVMGTRSGSIDPGIHAYLCERLQINIEALTHALNHDSGLLGLSKVSHDMRSIEEAAENGNPSATLALEVYAYRLAQAIMGMATALDQLDAVVFTGGIGENSSEVRARTIGHLKLMGLHLDLDANQSPHRPIGHIESTDSRCPLLVIQTQEEIMIAEQSRAIIGGTHD